MVGCCGEEPVDSETSNQKSGSSKYGEAKTFDPNFKGPIANRSCTDVVCLVIFFVFILGQVVVCIFAYIYGNPKYLIYPVDSDGNICGLGSKANATNLFYFDVTKCSNIAIDAISGTGCPTPTVCLTTCPTTYWVWTTVSVSESIQKQPDLTQRSQMICKNNVDPTKLPYLNYSISYLIANQLCAAYYLDSKPLVSRCVPSLLFNTVNLLQNASTIIYTSANQALVTANNTPISYQLLQQGSAIFQAISITEAVVNNIAASWQFIVCGLCIGIGVSFLYIVLLRCLAGVIVWLTLILFFLGFFGGAAYCYYRYYFIATQSFQTSGFQFSTNLDVWASYASYKEVWLGVAIVLTILGLIVLFIIICLRKRLQLAIALIGQASKAVGSIPTTLIFPLFPLIFELGVIAFWASVMLFLASVLKASGNSTIFSGVNCSTSLTDIKNYGCNFFLVTGIYWPYILQAYNLFMGLWLLNFFIALGEMILAGAYASWYWAWEKPKDVPAFPLGASLYRSIRYHLGTLAFGSLIITIIQFVRIILEYIDRRTKASQNACAKFIMCCMKCCLWCLEKIIKIINKNAYIMTAIYGTSFCASARNAFSLLMRNIVRTVVVDRTTSFVLFIGKLLIVGGVVSLCWYIQFLPAFTTNNPNMQYFYVPLIIIAVGTLIFSCLFLSVFEFAVETLFLCVLEDLERHDGSASKPYFMSKSLMRILSVHNEFDDSKKSDGCGLCCC